MRLLLLCCLVSLTSSLRSVSSNPLLDKLHSLMEGNKNGYSTLSLLRSDSDLCCDDLTDGALNVYVAQAIIESLKSERSVKSDPPPSPNLPAPSPNPLYPQPITIKVAIDNSRQDQAMTGMAEKVASLASNVEGIRECVKEVGECVREGVKEMGESVREVGAEVASEVKSEIRKQER